MLPLSVVYGFALVGLCVFAKDNRSNLQKLCANEEIELTRQSEVTKLADELAKGKVDCPNDVQDALVDINSILKDYNDKNVCSMEFAKRLKDYYLKYLDTSEERVERDEVKKQGNKQSNDKNNARCCGLMNWFKRKKSPTSLKKFVLAYGLQVVNKCKRAMAFLLTHDPIVEGKDEDIGKLGNIYRAMFKEGEASDLKIPSDIVMPSDFNQLLDLERVNDMPKIFYVQTRFSYEIDKVKTVCERRFQPIYEPVIMPINVLSSVGFDYRDSDFKYEFKSEQYLAALTSWSRIAFLCELAKVIVPVPVVQPTSPPPAKPASGELEDEESDDDSQEFLGGLFTLVTESEAKKFLAKLAHTKKDPLDQLERIEYEPKFKVVMHDRIFQESDTRLMRAIKSVDTSKTRVENMKGMIERELLTTLRKYLLSNIFMFSVSRAFKDYFLRETSNGSQHQSDYNAMLDKIDDMIERAHQVEQKKTPKEFVAFILEYALISGLLVLVLVVAVVTTLFVVASAG